MRKTVSIGFETKVDRLLPLAFSAKYFKTTRYLSVRYVGYDNGNVVYRNTRGVRKILGL